MLVDEPMPNMTMVTIVIPGEDSVWLAGCLLLLTNRLHFAAKVHRLHFVLLTA